MTSPPPSPPAGQKNAARLPSLVESTPMHRLHENRLPLALGRLPSTSTPQAESPARRDQPELHGVQPRGSPPLFPASAVNFQGTIQLPSSVPYLVLGFGTHRAPSSHEDSDGFLFGSGPPSAEKMISSGSEHRVQWSEELITVYWFDRPAKVSLPPCTDVVGAASGDACFPPGSTGLYQFENYSLVEFPDGSKYSDVRGIIYPVRYPRAGRIVYRRTRSDIRLHPTDHLISAGFAITRECRVSQGIAEAHGYPDQFSILSQNYAVRLFDRTRTTLHDPYFMRDLPTCLKECEQNVASGVTGLAVHIRGVPYLVATFCIFLLVCPGIVQAYGSDDNRWGDIVNEAIGTGSVLLGAVFVVFQRKFGAEITSLRAFRGTFTIRSNLGARIFASSMVREIEEMACDPRIPAGLIERYKNCAVRTDGTGWLKVGRSIKLSDMGKHGYYVLRDQGLVLDLVEARYYTCSKIGKVVHINRTDQHTSGSRCDRFDGDEVFEGE